MWSFSILLWELETREVPFAELEAMEIGMKVMIFFFLIHLTLTLRIFAVIVNGMSSPREFFYWEI